MAKAWADVYLADEAMWNGLDRFGRPTIVTPQVPPEAKNADRVIPFIAMRQSWPSIIDKVIDELDKNHKIHRLYMCGHGTAGGFCVGSDLTVRDDKSIAEFKRLRRFTAPWLTNVYIIGCEVAAEGPCQVRPLKLPDGHVIQAACLGPFTGQLHKPGYQLMLKLADVLEAPVHASPWKLAIRTAWDAQLRMAKLTVGPGGGWVYSAIDQPRTIFGSPADFQTIRVQATNAAADAGQDERKLLKDLYRIR